MTQRRVKGFRRWQLRTPPYLPSSLQCAHTCRSYEILVSAESREAYDRYGMEGMARGGAGGGFGPGVNPEDIFAELEAEIENDSSAAFREHGMDELKRE